MQDIPSPANEGELAGAFSCIDRIKKFKVSVALGIPTEESVEEGVMNFIGNKVCTQVNKVMNQATAKINKSISFPGIPGVSGTGTTGSIYVGGAGGVNVNGQPVSTPGINGASRPQFQTANPQAAQQSQPQPTVFERLTRSIRNAF